MSQDPSGIHLNYKYVAEKDDEDEERGDRGEEVSYLTDDGGEPFVPSLIRIPCDGEDHNPSGIRLQCKHKKEDGGERDGGMRFLQPTLIRLPPADEHGRENIPLSNADGDNKKPAATADLSRASDHDVSPKTVVRTLGEPVYRVQFPQADSPTGRRHHSMYKMEMKASKNSHRTAPPSAFDAASLGDPWPSSSNATLPGAQWASPESERIKNDTICQAAAGNKPMLRPHFVSSPATEPPLPGSAQLKSPPVLSPSTNVAATAPPPTVTGPKNNHEDFMHVKALVRAWDKINVEMKSAPTDNRVPFGPEFKDQARGFNPIEKERIEMKSVPTDNPVPFGPKFKDQARGFNPTEEERVENVDSDESSTGGPTLRHQMREEDSEEEVDTEASDASISDRGHGAISNGTTRLVEAELVIPAEAEVIEEKPQRKAWLVVFALLLTGAIVGSIVGSILSPDPKDKDTPPNQVCEDAITLQAGEESVRGSTLGALAGPKDSNCGTAYGHEVVRAVWYSVTGTDEVLTAFTCADFDNQILVYNGTCGNLTCIDGNDDYDGSTICSSDYTAAVGWFAKAGMVYYIKVNGYYDGAFGNTAVGTFELGISSVPKQDCEDAIMLEAGQETVQGTMLGALAGPKDSFCGTAFDHEVVPAVWYSVTGTDEDLTAFTCADFNNQILVYNGTCGSLTCIDLNYYSDVSTICSSDFAEAVSWFAKAGKVYYIKVTGYSYDFGIGNIAASTFEFGILNVPKQDCEDAIKLEAGQETVKGSTLFVLAGPKDSFCGTAVDPEGVPAVWYSVTGTDEDLTAFTCADFDNQILVYNGTCGNLTCIDGNDYYNDLLLSSCSSSSGYYTAAGVSWFAKAGKVYYIKVTGYSDGAGAVGTFELGIQIGKFSEWTPENDNCENAMWFGQYNIAGYNIAGSTLYATPSGFLSDELSVCNGESLRNYHSSPDVWYQFNGTGEWHTATTCTGIESLDYFDSYVAIYSGTCSNLTCITSNDNAIFSNCSWRNAIVSWFAEEGETYLIRVSGTDEYGTGDFGIRIDDGKIELPPEPEPVNNHCENATLLELDQVVNGTTVAATPSLEMPACDQGTYNPGEGYPDVWYYLLGTGDILTVTTCTKTSFDDSGFDTYLVVYTGNCTSEMTCIADNDFDDRDSCSGDYLSGVSWQSELNEKYYVRVLGYDVFTDYPFGTFGVKAYRGTPDGKPLPDPDSTIPPSYG